MKFYVLLITALAISVACFGQSMERNDKGEVQEEVMESLLSSSTEERPYEEMFEDLAQKFATPLNLNKASKEDLAGLFLLSDLQVRSFMEFREAQGKLLSINELQVIEGFDLETIYKIAPFLTVEEKVDYRGLLNSVIHDKNKYLLIRYDNSLERKKGSKEAENRFEGGQNKLYGRLRISSPKQYSIGLTFEKDSGEKLKWSPGEKWYGFDHFSGHIMVQNKKILKSAIIGDYQLQIGQGLLLSGKFSPGKSAESVTTLRKSSVGIRPYTSVMETGFFKGAAATFAKGRYQMTGFCSFLNQDGQLRHDTVSGDHINAIQINGLHRTKSELEARKKIRETVVGGNMEVAFPKDNLKIGVNYVATVYSHQMMERPNKYNQFDFIGSYNYCYSFYSTYEVRNMSFFGEGAISRSGGKGVVAGMLTSFSSTVDLGVLYRNYERNFHSFYGNSFGENTRNVNEKGIYLGIKLKPIKRITISAYFDNYEKPWLSYQAYAPTVGYEYLTRLQYQPSKKLIFYGQIKRDIKEKNLRENVGKTTKLAEERTTSYVLSLDYKAHKILSLKSRVQFSSVSQDKYSSKGMAIIENLSCDLRRLKITLQYSLFDTKDYSTRQYAYERDVLYSFSFPAYSGQGTRNFVLISYHLTRNLDCWLKLSKTTLNNVESIGSSMDEISGNEKTDIRVQLRYRL